MRTLVRLTILLTTLFFVGQVALTTVGKFSLYPDPFVQYRAIMPGQPSNTLQRYPCRWRPQSGNGEQLAYCQFAPEIGPFSIVTVEYDDVIRRIGFVVRPGRLYLGDLMQCWGHPTGVEPDASHFAEGLIDIYWGKQTYAQIEASQSHYRARLAYFVAISAVTIGGENTTCGSGQ